MSVRNEEVDVTSFLSRIRSVGWLDGSSIVGVGEGELVPLFFENLVRGAVRRINRGELSSLTSEDEELVLREVLNKLHSDGEDKILRYLKRGVKVYVRRRQSNITVRLVDYDKLENNVFFYLVRPRFRGSPSNIEPDIVLYVNGIPLVVVEVKRLMEPDSYLEALRQIRRYESFSPDLFRFIQFGVAVGDVERVTPTWPNRKGGERDAPAFRWVVKERGPDGRVREREDVVYILEPRRLLEYVRYFIFYRRERGGELEKVIARYNQYYAAKMAMRRIDEYMAGGELNRGLVWHWLGSGKTYTMFFIANYFLDRYWDRRPVVFFVVDRSDLEEQHENALKSIEEPGFTRLFKKIGSIKELHDRIRILKESEYTEGTIAYGVYLTTIQKFQRGPKAAGALEDAEESVEEFRGGLLDLLKRLGEEYLEFLKRERPDEYEKHRRELERLRGRDREEYLVGLGQVKGRNILLLIDEAHRSQYGILAAMRKLVFPNAMAFGFTGTPIFKHEKNTFVEFGYPERGEYYLDVYFIRDSVRDRFTLPLVYQAVGEGEVSSEGVRIKLSEEEIRGFIEEYMRSREAGVDVLEQLDPSIYRKVGKYIDKVRVFLMNEKRVDKLARYIAERVEEDTEGFKFKAMVVAVNRLACIMFKRKLEEYLVRKYGDKAREWVEVVMTYNYNDTDEMIVSYRKELEKRFNTSDLNEVNREIQRRFLEEENPRILVVTDMLITGFDAPMLKVMYLDKPLYEHRLLQAIARVNRPYPGKEFGLIVDSIGLLEHLSKTLALYNMIADEEIVRDFEENLMVDVDSKVEEFVGLYNSVKDRLSKLKLGGGDVSINLDALKEELRSKSFNRAEFEAKVGLIALYASASEAGDDVARAKRLVNDMRRVLKLFKALGGHPKKPFYADDVEVLAFVYGSILKKMRRPRTMLGREFWKELVKLIHSKTLVEEFNRIAEAKLDDKTLDNLLMGTEVPTLELKRAIADYYFYLKSILLKNPHDPIYREIMRRLERLRKEWISRKIDLRTFLARLRALDEERLKYEERVKGKPLEDKIVEAIDAYMRSQVLKGQKISLELRNVKREIRRMLTKKKTPIIKTTDKQRLSKALLRDLFRELKDKLDEGELTEFARISDRLVNEFVVEELERALRGGVQGTAEEAA